MKGLSLSFVNLTLAFAMGFSVASLPGPMIILITTETLRKGLKAGLITMTAPLLLDALVMLPIGLLLRAALFSGTGALFLGFLGASLLGWLGLQSIRAAAELIELPARANSLSTTRNQEIPPFLKGVMTHLANPFPYLYWGTVGSSFIRQGFENGGIQGAVLFPLGFWLGASVFTLLAIYLAARTKRLLPPRFEPHLHRLSGLLLIGSGIFLAYRVWQGSF